MTNTEFVKNEYFNWLTSHLNSPEYNLCDYSLLLSALYDEPFEVKLKLDWNRHADGIEMRHNFARELGLSSVTIDMAVGTTCSVLEMMIALALRCENDIMGNWDIGDRTNVWFWQMIQSLGLIGMTDDTFDSLIFKRVMTIFINRRYESNGAGGLFTIMNPTKDMRSVEIWYQMAAHLNDILNS